MAAEAGEMAASSSEVVAVGVAVAEGAVEAVVGLKEDRRYVSSVLLTIELSLCVKSMQEQKLGATVQTVHQVSD